ncbi:MAG: beta-ketoacyl-[acyl-carrier-protein] synthase family protein [Bacteroidota bacterium]
MRIVITGMGVVAPNGVGLADFEEALRQQRSGIRFLPELADLKFGCQIGGIPEIDEATKRRYFTDLELKSLKASGVLYGVIAGQMAWEDAGLSEISEREDEEPDWDSGCLFGAGLAGAEVMRDATYLIDGMKVRRLGSTAVPQVMSSGVSAFLGGKLGLGNQVSTNASACSTGTESILLAMARIKSGLAKRMLCGACDSSGPYVWGGFDAMRVMTRRFNDHPTAGSRPLSATASGFVPGSGAGALVLESLEDAQARGAKIYAEVLGGAINSGGQRQGGTMTAPNKRAIVRCIHQALENTGIQAQEIDAISGHLTSTMFDPAEVEQWCLALDRKGSNFPYIRSLKSMIGHCLSAAGAIESVAAVLELYKGFLHGTINCEDLHPEVEKNIAPSIIPQRNLDFTPNIIAKSSFGFGDVNSCVLFKKYKP